MSVEKAIDTCIQCGFCLQSCPTYRLFRREESSPRGRIARLKDILQGDVEPSYANLQTFEECLGCRACETACPSGVPYEEILLEGRARLRAAAPPQAASARAALRVLRSDVLLRAAKSAWRRRGRDAVRWARRRRSHSSALRLLAALPEPASAPALERRPGAQVQVHQGCVMDIVWPETNAKAVLLLRRAGIAADLLPASTGCCGALHAHQGDLPAAREMARRVIAAFEASGGEVLVSLAGGCAAHLASYGRLLEDDPLWAERALAMSRRVEDISRLLLGQGYRPAPPGPGERVTYQDSCHLRHGLGVQREPRELLAGEGYRPLGGDGACCGSAGIYNLLRPDVSDRLLAAKVAEIRQTGAETVVTGNPGCALQLRLGARESGDAYAVRHLVDWLYERPGETQD